MNKILLLALIVLALVAIPSVLGATTQIVLDEPDTNDLITGIYNFSALVDNDDDTVNVTWFYLSGSTWIPFTSVINTTENQTSFSSAVATSSLSDGYQNYTWNATAIDIGRDHLESDSSLTVSVDNTAPTASVSLTHNFLRKHGLNQIATCVTDDIVDSSLTTTQVLTSPSGDTTSVSDLYWIISKDETLLLSSTDGYSINCSTVDDAGFTGSSTQLFSVFSEDEKVPVDKKAEEARKVSNLIIPIILVVVLFAVVGLIIWLVYLGRKGKRK